MALSKLQGALVAVSIIAFSHSAVFGCEVHVVGDDGRGKQRPCTPAEASAVEARYAQWTAEQDAQAKEAEEDAKREAALDALIDEKVKELEGVK